MRWQTPRWARSPKLKPTGLRRSTDLRKRTDRSAGHDVESNLDASESGDVETGSSEPRESLKYLPTPAAVASSACNGFLVGCAVKPFSEWINKNIGKRQADQHAVQPHINAMAGRITSEGLERNLRSFQRCERDQTDTLLIRNN